MGRAQRAVAPDEIPSAEGLKARLAEFDQRVRQGQKLRRDREREPIVGDGGKLAPLQRLAGQNIEPSVVGHAGADPCPDCGTEVPRTLETVGSWLQMWKAGEHDCAAKAARREAEFEAKRREREAWLRNPPESRIAEVRRACQLPWWTPAGLAQVRTEQAFAVAVQRLLEHRAEWSLGRRPSRGLWLFGETNHRKTCASCALVFDVAHETERPALFWNFEDLLEQHRLAAQNRKHRLDPERIEAAHLLVLDDLGSVKYSEAAWRTLFGLVNGANDAWGSSAPRQTLYVTSNEDPDRLESIITRSVPQQEQAGARIVRRLVQLCEPVEVC